MSFRTVGPRVGSVDAEEESAAPSVLSRLQATLHRHPPLGPTAVLIVAIVVFSLINPRFLSFQNASLMLAELAVVGTLAIGQTVIVLTAGIDLSCGAAMIFIQMIIAGLATNFGVPPILALLIGFVLGAGVGAVNGFFVSGLHLQPFIVTLGTLSVFTALGLVYSNGETVFVAKGSPILWTGVHVSLGPLRLTAGVLVMVALYIVVGYMLRGTSWGSHVYATGDEPEAARLVGIKTGRLLLSVYIVAGVIYAFAAWIQIGYVGDANTNISDTLNLESITAVAIGGTSLFGGRGVLVGSLLGAIIVQIFDTGLILASVNPIYQPLAEGLLVLGAVALDRWIRQDRTRA